MKKFILFALCGFILTGCWKEQPVETEEYRDVVVVFKTDELQSFVKSTATPAEKNFTEIQLFGVDASNNVIKKFDVIPSGSIDNGKVTLYMLTKITKLYAIANPTTDNKNANPANVTALESMYNSFTANNASPFLMSGIGTVSGYNAAINLVRAVAKVEIVSEDNEYTITSVTVKNARNQGYVFGKDPVAIPPSAGTAANATVNSATPILYVAESTATAYPTFTVSGTLNSKTITGDVVLKQGGTTIPIKRNVHYKVGVKPADGTDGVLTFEFLDWVDAPTDGQIFSLN